jgi:hypothetical protein
MNTVEMHKEILEMNGIELALAYIIISIVCLFLARYYINSGKVI